LSVFVPDEDDEKELLIKQLLREPLANVCVDEESVFKPVSTKSTRVTDFEDL
jgi:hypothetical protein